jgi:hypothetical protein
MSLDNFLTRLRTEPEAIDFEDTMAIIDANYRFTPTAFRNGSVSNAAGENNGSCKILSFAQLNQLDADQTLACFGRYFRDDVLKHPDGSDHGNIRNFLANGWIGVEFEGTPLVAN